MNNSVLVVGIDGASWKVLNPLIKKGKMPFLKKLKADSSYGILKSPIPPLSAPSWVSFQTGVNPGKHGIFEFLDYRTKDLKPRINTSKDIKVKRIWEVIESYGHKSLIINMPLSYPVSKINGIMVSSFLTPVGESYTYPKKIEKELKQIDYEIDILVTKDYGVMPDKRLNAKERKYYLEKLISISEKRVQAYKLLSKKGKYSFQFLLFKESDIAQHLFWGKSELDDFYNKLDDLIEEVYEYYNTKGNHFIIISDHGFHKAPVKQFSPHVWLDENCYKRSNNMKLQYYWNIVSKLNSKLKSLGINPTQNSMLRKLKQDMLSKGKEQYQEERKIVVTLNGLFINIEEAKEKEKLINMVVKEFKQIKDKGNKVFDLVTTPENIYHGPYFKKAPDVLWMVNEKYSINVSPFADDPIDNRKSTLIGDHNSDPEGVFIANGKRFSNEKSGNEKIENIFLLILNILDCRRPWYIDGFIPDFFKERINLVEKAKIDKKIQKEIANIINEK